MKVIGYDASGKKVGADRSDAPFTMSVVTIMRPNGVEILTSGSTGRVEWETYGTKKPVARVKLLYTKNGGRSWNRIETLEGNPGFCDWTVPEVPKTKTQCRVKVVLKDANGKTVGNDTSDSHFTIEPSSYAEP